MGCIASTAHLASHIPEPVSAHNEPAEDSGPAAVISADQRPCPAEEPQPAPCAGASPCAPPVAAERNAPEAALEPGTSPAKTAEMWDAALQSKVEALEEDEARSRSKRIEAEDQLFAFLVAAASVSWQRALQDEAYLRGKQVALVADWKAMAAATVPTPTVQPHPPLQVPPAPSAPSFLPFPHVTPVALGVPHPR